MKIEQQRTHGSTFPVHYETFVNVLDRAGYKVGFTGKGWAPGDWLSGGRSRNPAGDEYQQPLNNTLTETGDPRVLGYGHVWEDYPRQKGPMRYFPQPD